MLRGRRRIPVVRSVEAAFRRGGTTVAVIEFRIHQSRIVHHGALIACTQRGVIGAPMAGGERRRNWTR